MDSPAPGPPPDARSGVHTDQVRLRLPAHQESLPALRALALNWAERAGLGQAVVQRLDLVLEEMLMNVFHHAYPGELGDVELALAPSGQGGPPGQLSLTLTDWGVAFDPLAPQDPSLAANLGAGLDERAPGGMGLFLLRTLAHGSYARQGQANVLTLTFAPEANP
jgi:anti-sigma regulatory factor (Ser/Thr protein kinase)